MTSRLGIVAWVVAVAAGAVGMILACGPNDESGGKTCEPGDTASCTGPNACVGTKSCVGNGIAWTACSCSGTGGASGAAGAGGADPCPPGEGDGDGDCFGTADDCDDADQNVNPGAFDVPDNGIDDDCSGAPDDAAGCDQEITDLADADALSGAKAIGLCQVTSAEDWRWGVLSAKYVKADGSDGMAPVSHGLLPGFGPNVKPREGTRLLVLSSGAARQPADPGYQAPGGYDTGTDSPTPAGYPVSSPSCGPSNVNNKVANNPAALEITLRVPTNAHSLAFDFDYYTYEFPGYVCSSFNDFFVALAYPPPQNALSSNIAFDGEGNPVSVNNAYLRVCEPQTAGGKTFDCPLGLEQLAGTGFGEPESTNHGATGWLVTRAPVEAGSEITLRFAIWDMSDAILDSTILIDNFRFSAGEMVGAATTPVE